MLELVGAGQEVRFFISLGLEQHVSKYLVHNFCHAVLLGDTTVVLDRQDHRVPAGRKKEKEKEREGEREEREGGSKREREREREREGRKDQEREKRIGSSHSGSIHNIMKNTLTLQAYM